MVKPFVLWIITCLILICPLSLAGNNETNGTHHDSELTLAKWHVEGMEQSLMIMSFVLCVILIRTVYERIPFMARNVPESVILLLFGVAFGALIKYVLEPVSSLYGEWKLTPQLFFFHLLPPIILDSAYGLYNRAITDYIIIIIIFAVIGTIMNFILISLTMYAAHQLGMWDRTAPDFDLAHFMLFSAIIIAVDPVAVLAIFQDIGVNLGLYFIVFGESLFNDAITVVIYNIMSVFTGKKQVFTSDVFMAFLSCFSITVGGLFVGFIFGVASCLLTRIRSPFDAVYVLLLGYFSYLLSDAFGWSGIMAMIMCGIIQAAYAFDNLKKSSLTVVRKVTSIVAGICEAVIFLFIGLEIFSRKYVWYTAFYLWGLAACLIARFVTVPLLSTIINLFSIENTKISLTHQIIMAYGGLRGAVCLCLAVLIKPTFFSENGVHKREMIISATLFIIVFTMVVMGLTVKPLVLWLKIPMRASKELSLFKQLNEHILDEALSGIEALVGYKRTSRIRYAFVKFDDKYIRKILQREPNTRDQKFVQTYEKIALKLHYAMIQPDQTDLHLQTLPEGIKVRFKTSQSEDTSEVIVPIKKKKKKSFIPEHLRASMAIRSFNMNFDDDHEQTTNPISDRKQDMSAMLNHARRVTAYKRNQNRTHYGDAYKELLHTKTLVAQSPTRTLKKLHQMESGTNEVGLIKLFPIGRSKHLNLAEDSEERQAGNRPDEIETNEKPIERTNPSQPKRSKLKLHDARRSTFSTEESDDSEFD